MESKMEVLGTINERYSGLAESNCCLSCGGAVGAAGVAPGETCVDLGSGRGNDAIRMADLCAPAGKVVGVDISDGMIDRARRTAEKLGIANIEFIQSPLDRLPLGDGFADLVISNCTLNHAPDKLAVWREIHRVLRPGGRFVISDIYSTEEVPAQYRNDPRAVAECWAGASTREEYIRTMRRAGFTVFEILEESIPYEKGAIRVASWTIRGYK